MTFLFFSGLVLFLEEDHYVAEDFLYMLQFMQVKALEICPQCNIISLGTYIKAFNYFSFNSNNKVNVSLFIIIII